MVDSIYLCPHSLFAAFPRLLQSRGSKGADKSSAWSQTGCTGLKSREQVSRAGGGLLPHSPSAAAGGQVGARAPGGVSLLSIPGANYRGVICQVGGGRGSGPKLISPVLPELGRFFFPESTKSPQRLHTDLLWECEVSSVREPLMNHLENKCNFFPSFKLVMTVL